MSHLAVKTGYAQVVQKHRYLCFPTFLLVSLLSVSHVVALCILFIFYTTQCNVCFYCRLFLPHSVIFCLLAVYDIRLWHWWLEKSWYSILILHSVMRVDTRLGSVSFHLWSWLCTSRVCLVVKYLLLLQVILAKNVIFLLLLFHVFHHGNWDWSFEMHAWLNWFYINSSALSLTPVLNAVNLYFSMGCISLVCVCRDRRKTVVHVYRIIRVCLSLY